MGVLGLLEIIEPGSAVFLDESPPVFSLEIASLLMITCRSCQRPHPHAVQAVLPSAFSIGTPDGDPSKIKTYQMKSDPRQYL